MRLKGLIKSNQILIKRFTVMSFMMMIILYIYSIQRSTKDALIVTYVGAELISSIKLLGVLPMAIVFILAFTKMSDVLNKTKIFHIFNLTFIIFFLIFTFILHPNLKYITFNLNSLKEIAPFFQYVIMMIENWALSLFFIFSELWGSIMLSLLFWKTANQIFKINQAKVFYPLFGFLAQAGLFLSGFFTQTFTQQGSTTEAAWQSSLNNINISVAFAGVILSILYFYLCNYLVDIKLINSVIKKKKVKMRFIAGMKYIFASKYIRLIAALVICYGVSINLVEGLWKAEAKLLYPNPSDYARFMGKVQMITSIAAALSMLSGSFLLSFLTWKKSAMLTPIVIALTGIPFFIFAIFDKSISGYFYFLTVSPVVISVMAGSIQNIMSKSIKYSFFDPTKEMAYIPLSDNLKSKGKAAADVIGGRLGKSGGAFIQFILLMIFPGASLMSLAPILFLTFIIILIYWMRSVYLLSRKFEDASSNQNNSVDQLEGKKLA